MLPVEYAGYLGINCFPFFVFPFLIFFLPLYSKARPFHDAAEKDHDVYKEKKKAYDDSKPKRPRTAYAFFMKENRSRVAAEHPDESPRDLMKYIAAAWKECDENEKAKYTQMAVDDRARWAKDRAGSL